MKINGIQAGPFEDVFVLPRKGKDFVFKLKAVPSYAEFDKILPRPVPITVQLPDGKVHQDDQNPAYLKSWTDYLEMRTHWLRLQTIKDTEGLVWEKVSLDSPTTYKEYITELREFGMCEGEIIGLLNAIDLVNSVDGDKLEEAKKRFLSGTGT